MTDTDSGAAGERDVDFEQMVLRLTTIAKIVSCNSDVTKAEKRGLSEAADAAQSEAIRRINDRTAARLPVTEEDVARVPVCPTCGALEPDWHAARAFDAQASLPATTQEQPTAAEMRKALEDIALLDEADGHELTVQQAFRAVAIATRTLGKHPSEICAARYAATPPVQAPAAVKPHSYWPDYQAMGDCLHCGNVQDHPLHVQAPAAANSLSREVDPQLADALSAPAAGVGDIPRRGFSSPGFEQGMQSEWDKALADREAAARADEREQCAKVAEGQRVPQADNHNSACVFIAAAIRARTAAQPETKG